MVLAIYFLRRAILVSISSFISDYLTNGLFHVFGKIFISSIKMMVVPLVAISLICGVTGIGDISKLGRVGGKTLAFYMITTCLAISLALIIACHNDAVLVRRESSWSLATVVGGVPCFSELARLSAVGDEDRVGEEPDPFRVACCGRV